MGYYKHHEQDRYSLRCRNKRRTTYTMSKIDTVCVVETVEGLLTGVCSFDETAKGNNEAEELFKQIALENGGEQEELESCFDNGYFDKGTYAVFITHSL